MLLAKLYTLMMGKLVGTDALGNRYYTKRGEGDLSWRQQRRWVMYHGEHEASKVPAEWHGWLHHTCEEPPALPAKKYTWQKPHLPNLTGTKYRYLPAQHVLNPQAQPRQTYYKAWQPEN